MSTPTYGRDVKRIKIKAGGPFYIGSNAFGSGSNYFKNMGIVQKGQLLDKTGAAQKGEWTGNEFRLQSNRMVDINAVLEQTSTHEMKLGDLIGEEFIQLLFFTGKIGAASTQMIFVREAQLFTEVDLQIPGEQIIKLDFSVIPQASNVQVTYGGATQIGTNVFYCQSDILTSAITVPGAAL